MTQDLRWHLGYPDSHDPHKPVNAPDFGADGPQTPICPRLRQIDSRGRSPAAHTQPPLGAECMREPSETVPGDALLSRVCLGTDGDPVLPGLTLAQLGESDGKNVDTKVNLG